MSPWITLVMQAVATVIQQWVNSSADDQAAIEKAALDAVTAMVTARQSTDADHAARTAALLAQIAAVQK